jgi:hypothetical protein
MELSGSVDVYDWSDPVTGLTIRLADFDLGLMVKLRALHGARAGAPAVKTILDNFNDKVLDRMEFQAPRIEGEAPLYYWVRAMKLKNRLSFEDGQYNIPDNLAACIVRCPGARTFIQLLGEE